MMKDNYTYKFLKHKTMFELAELLFPMARSLTGSGIKKSFEIFQLLHKEFKQISFQTGDKVGDWEIPEEWNIDDGYIELENGNRICEFKKCNLSIVGYSVPINKIVSFKELKNHLHFREDFPNAIPYITSYYKKYWGFCLEYNKFKKLNPKEKYKCVIKSELKSGTLNLIEAIIPCDIKKGIKKDIFFSSYLCHPSMANNELSGPILVNEIIKYSKQLKHRKYNYRFVLLPETIGSIAYLSKKSKDLISKVICGFNLSCCGDNNRYTHIQSPFGDNLADKALEAALIGKKNVISKTFLERGSDERQYCSPMVNLPLCGFSRSKFGDYKEYHTNLDNLNFISEEGLQGSFEVIKSIIDAFEFGLYPICLTLGEPQLGKRGLYKNFYLNKEGTIRDEIGIRKDIIAYSNGRTSIFEIAIHIKVPLSLVLKELKLLNSYNLIQCND